MINQQITGSRADHRMKTFVRNLSESTSKATPKEKNPDIVDIYFDEMGSISTLAFTW